jgi:DNA-binding SARP family transcriptional activator
MLRLLGKPHVALDGNILTDLPDKAFVLLALLSLQFAGVASRDQLRTLLWEDSTAERAAASLRWLLSTIRAWETQHGRALLSSGRSTLSLAADLDCDIVRVMDCEGIETVDQMERLLDAYRGELLSGLDGGLGPQLVELVGRHRAALRAKYIALGQNAAARIGGERGERVLRTLIYEAPDEEALTRTLLLHLNRERGARAVEKEYRAFSARLKADYDAKPSVETAALYAQLVPATAANRPAATDAESPPDGSGIPRIVLLPPAMPLAVDPQAALIADAMIEDVSLQLCRMRTFAMFAPHTARQVAGLDPVAAVAPYGVSYVAATRLLPAFGGGLRLSLSLIRTATNSIVFADQFDFDQARLGVRFAELAEAIAGHLSAAIEKVELGTFRQTGAASAYVQYLLGTKVIKSTELKALRRARHHFARALELEPNYVPAMTGIAHTLRREELALRRTDRELAERALRIADRAVEIDPLDPAAWREKAMASLYLHDIDGSLAYLDTALTRAPHHADLLAEKADVLSHASRPQEARQYVLQALGLNPLAPDDYYWTLGSTEFFLGRHPEAVQAFLRMKNSDGAARMISASAAMAGDMPLSTQYRERWLGIYPSSRIADIGRLIPHSNPRDVDYLCDALRRAGFPE